jgi:ApbE superfamily uncharacterized protein (UPF0280 family)
MKKQGLASFRVVVKETDLHIQADRDLASFARERVMAHRDVLEKYAMRYPEFVTTLSPWMENDPKPAIVEEMTQAGRRAGVGPMAAVAGAIAARVGADLLVQSGEVIVENGGDVFLSTADPVTVGVHVGVSSLESKLAIRAGGGNKPAGICTSSGTIGHSLSFGSSNAVCVLSSSCALADAAATAIGNRVRGGDDIRGAIEWGRTIEAVQGIVIVSGEKVGAWGEVELVSFPGKKG